DAATRRERFSLVGHFGGVNTVAFSPTSDILASGGEDGTLRLWHLVEMGGYSLRRQAGGVNQVALSPNGQLLAAVGGICGQPGQRRRSDLVTPRERARLDGPADAGMTAASAPSGRYPLTCALAGERKIWDVAAGRGVV